MQVLEAEIIRLLILSIPRVVELIIMALIFSIVIQRTRQKTIEEFVLNDLEIKVRNDRIIALQNENSLLKKERIDLLMFYRTVEKAQMDTEEKQRSLFRIKNKPVILK